MKFGGVDPSIIRELSGIYKPFPKAFKELISNAFDADAKAIAIRFDQSARRLSVTDDGCGMTPFEFRRDFTKIGGSDKTRTGSRTPLGRLRIGCKGIGFLAVARYCARMVVRTHGPRIHRQRLIVTPRKVGVGLGEQLGLSLPPELMAKRVRISKINRVDSKGVLKIGKDVHLDSKHGVLHFSTPLLRGNARPLEVHLEIDCRGLWITATLDFEKLLKLAHTCDLYDLDSFCELTFENGESQNGFTSVSLDDLYNEVLEELSKEPRGGNAKSIEVRSGKEQLVWHLGRTVPLAYPITPWTKKAGLIEAETDGLIQTLPKVELHWNQEPPSSFTRQIFAADETRLDGSAFSIVPIDIAEAGLKAKGYLLATSEVITPPEYRGITVRVRNVAIGDPHFFGLERTMTGAQRAALQQITGELVILEGLDTPDALNPGRESFYEENPQAKRLKELMAGKPGTPGGIIRRAIRKVLEHSNLSSRARTYLAQGTRRRQALLNVASAINRYCSDGYQDLLMRFFTAGAKGTFTLKDAPTITLRPPTRLQDYSIQHQEELRDEFAIDQESKHIFFNYKQEVWDQQLYLAGDHYKVEAKRGGERDPLCEFDIANRSIYVNWSHHLKQQADEAQYLKQAILWTLAFGAGEKPMQVMELGLALLTHEES